MDQSFCWCCAKTWIIELHSEGGWQQQWNRLNESSSYKQLYQSGKMFPKLFPNLWSSSGTRIERIHFTRSSSVFICQSPLLPTLVSSALYFVVAYYNLQPHELPEWHSHIWWVWFKNWQTWCITLKSAYAKLLAIRKECTNRCS